MDDVARWPTDERGGLFTETSALAGFGTPLLMEKDFWVCWTLKRLFALSLDAGLIFKGGTSLSKVFGIIRRFSEDIDVSVDRHALGFTGERDPERVSRKRAKHLIEEELKAACEAWITEQLVPALRSEAAHLLNAGDTWAVTIDGEDRQCVLWEYPRSLRTVEYDRLPYLNPVVRIELGARSDHWPASTATVRPFSAETIPDVFTAPECEVKALNAERTFWEKATLLHAEFNRPESKDYPPRLARHYYDMVMLADSPAKDLALANVDLLHRVAQHNQLFFRSGWASYDTAVQGTLRVVPHERLASVLRRDYGEMTDLFFDSPPTFDHLLEALAALEAEINPRQ